MRILAIDLGKFKSVFVDAVTAGGEKHFGKFDTNAIDMEKLLIRHAPERLVIEACPASGWVCDLAEKLKIPVQVANANDERWDWKKLKEKSDRKDALKLATLSEMNSLSTVHVPRASVRQWRALIKYRRALVQRRTAIKNSIRSIYERQGLHLAAAQKAWTQKAVEDLKKQADDRRADEIWLFEVACELSQFQSLENQIEKVESQLKEIGDKREEVRRLQEAPCVGPRLAETVVAIIDDPHRFKNARQVGCYVGLTPRRMQSGQMDRQGRISKAGSRMLRSLLVEVAWIGVRNKTWMLEAYERIHRGSKTRKKTAIVAVARKLLVKLWAMMRDGTGWKEPLPVEIGRVV